MRYKFKKYSKNIVYNKIIVEAFEVQCPLNISPCVKRMWLSTLILMYFIFILPRIAKKWVQQAFMNASMYSICTTRGWRRQHNMVSTGYSRNVKNWIPKYKKNMPSKTNRAHVGRSTITARYVWIVCNSDARLCWHPHPPISPHPTASVAVSIIMKMASIFYSFFSNGLW